MSILRSIAFQRTLQLLQGRKKKKINNGQKKFYFKSSFNPIGKLLLVNKQHQKKKNLRLVKGVEGGKGGGSGGLFNDTCHRGAEAIYHT